MMERKKVRGELGALIAVMEEKLFTLGALRWYIDGNYRMGRFDGKTDAMDWCLMFLLASARCEKVKVNPSLDGFTLTF